MKRLNPSPMTDHEWLADVEKLAFGQTCVDAHKSSSLSGRGFSDVNAVWPQLLQHIAKSLANHPTGLFTETEHVLWKGAAQ